MDRSREARRAAPMAASATTTTNGLPRRRPSRPSSLRDSPLDEDVDRLRDRGSMKKDRERERERERLRSSSKRRRASASFHDDDDEEDEHVNDESSEEDESVNDDEDNEYEGNHHNSNDVGTTTATTATATTAASSSSSRMALRKSFPPTERRVSRVAPPWKAADEMIGVSVPRKARSASTKRSHESWSSAAFTSVVEREHAHRQASMSPVRPTSPASSIASMRKKMRPNGSKPKLPKSSPKPAASVAPAPAAQEDEIEFEIAEVLYGMMRQPQKPEMALNDSAKTDPNKSSSEAKSKVSSPISNSQTLVHQSACVLQQNSSSSAVTVSAVAPKRKKPRAVNEESSTIFTIKRSTLLSSTKTEIDQPIKMESSPSNMEKNNGFAAERGAVSSNLANSQPPSAAAPPLSQPQSVEAVKAESEAMHESKPKAKGEEESDKKDVAKKESDDLKLIDDRKNMTAKGTDVESKKDEKFQIDLMALPSSRSSPEREGEIDFVDQKAVVTDMSADGKPITAKEEKRDVNTRKEDEAKATAAQDDASVSQKQVNRERNIDLQLDPEKSDKDSGNRLNHHLQKNNQQPSSDKNAQSSSLPLPMSMPGWPGGLTPMGYMAPLPGVMSMDGSAVPSAALQPPQVLPHQPRLKRCATHCFIAKTIGYHQQLSRINPFWQAAAGSATLYGAKACNLNVVPPAELNGNGQSRGLNSAQENGQGLAIFPGNSGKDKGSQAMNITDAQRKQILLQQTLPPGAPNNILPAPAFIFPLSQQQAAAAAAAGGQPGGAKFPPTASSAASSSAPNSTSATAGVTAAGAAPAVSFNYPNMPGNEAQFLAVLPNNGYPFPIPAHLGTPAYRGTHTQAMPFFNGPFYSSQMLHPSQLQQQHQQPHPAQSQQSQQPHQTASTCSSSSHNHLLNQQQGPHGSGINNGSGSMQGFPAQKNQTSQQQQQQQQQRQQGQHLSHQSRQLESQVGGENSTSTADSRHSRPNMSVYSQNFPVSIHPNFAFMTPSSMAGGSGVTITSGSQGEKKQQPQQQGNQAFAMSFASINGASATAPILDISSLAQNPAFLQGFPEATRQSYQIVTAAQATQQKKNHEEGKGGATSSRDEERKGSAGKPSVTGSQSIAFSRPDMINPPASSMPGSSVIDSSARNLNLGSTPAQCSDSVIPATAVCNAANATGSQQQMQRNSTNLSLQQHYITHQLQKQQQYVAVAAGAARGKTPAVSSGVGYSDHHSMSSSMVSKIPNNLSCFPPSLVQSSSSPVQSPQLKNAGRSSVSQVSSPSLSSSISTSLKNVPQQQQSRTQNLTQISFGANPKSSTPQGQPPPSANHSPSPHMVVSSPSNSSMSKSASGSPRTTATSPGHKVAHVGTSSSLQVKNSPSVPSHKSNPVGGRTPSTLGNNHFNSSNSGSKQQLAQQQQQYSKHPHHQMFFSTAYMPGQASQSTSSAASANSGYYLHRRQPEQSQKIPQLQGSPTSNTTGMLSLCPPVTMANVNTSDPLKAAAAATSNMKGAGLPSQGLVPPQFAVAQSPGNSHLSAGFTYIQTVPAAVQVKPAEQKQPTGE